MKKTKIFELQSLYRENLVIEGYEFGEGDLGACIMGSLRGNEVQQLFVCSQLIRTLKEIEKKDASKIKKKIMVVPSGNHYSLNIEKRFWAPDNTDINRMFPGYDEGETVQRIADGIFDKIKDYPYGVQLTSNYVAGDYIPHIRVMNTGHYELNDAKKFGMPYVILREPRPYDTTTLNYNWQVWDTNAFSLYSGASDRVDNEKADMAYRAVLHFLNEIGILDHPTEMPHETKVINEENLVTVKSKHAGLFSLFVKTGQQVEKGETLAQICDPFEGEILDTVKAPCSGMVFFHHNKPMAYAKTIVFKILKNDQNK